jgi:hypothetical protein
VAAELSDVARLSRNNLALQARRQELGAVGWHTANQPRAILQQSADDLGQAGTDDFYGAGRVNALRAVLQR